MRSLVAGVLPQNVYNIIEGNLGTQINEPVGYIEFAQWSGDLPAVINKYTDQGKSKQLYSIMITWNGEQLPTRVVVNNLDDNITKTTTIAWSNGKPLHVIKE